MVGARQDNILHALERSANRNRVGEVADRQFDRVAEQAVGLVRVADEGAHLVKSWRRWTRTRRLS